MDRGLEWNPQSRMICEPCWRKVQEPILRREGMALTALLLEGATLAPVIAQRKAKQIAGYEISEQAAAHSQIQS